MADLIREREVTDLMVYGDWRPHHREAVHIARLMNISVWAYDEGYLRPNWITMERGGVNGNSTLPRTPEAIRAELACDLVEPGALSAPNPLHIRQWHAFRYAALSLLGMPFFPFYRTHRPYSHLRELFSGWIPHHLTSRKRLRNSQEQIDRIGGSPYFLFPLQLDSDSQVRRYSPFSGMKEAIAYVLTSFARFAPSDVNLVIRNHPLDNGLIRYDRFIRSFSRACGVAGRVFFVESGNGLQMIRDSRAVVLLNSTMGMQSLEQGKPVYCVGRSIYAMDSLAENAKRKSLDEFWKDPTPPDTGLLRDFEKVVRCRTLVNGNFYFGEGLDMAVRGCLERLLRPEARPGSASEQPSPRNPDSPY
ncbi:MAG: capsular biosynthesis protein, partial [Mailhella sp.]|nr:capsular biosynthesis protein [Mailhella sp.]